MWWGEGDVSSSAVTFVLGGETIWMDRPTRKFGVVYEQKQLQSVVKRHVLLKSRPVNQ